MMKQVKQWTNRLSLAMFVAGISYVAFNVKSFPEVAHIQSGPEALINLLSMMLL